MGSGSDLHSTPLVCSECGGERDATNMCCNNFHWTGGGAPGPLDRPLHHPIGYDVDETPFDCEECGQPWPCAFERAEQAAGDLADLREKCALVMVERDDALAELAALRQQIMVLVNGMHCEHGYPAQGMGCEHDPGLTGDF